MWWGYWVLSTNGFTLWGSPAVLYYFFIQAVPTQPKSMCFRHLKNSHQYFFVHKLWRGSLSQAFEISEISAVSVDLKCVFRSDGKLHSLINWEWEWNIYVYKFTVCFPQIFSSGHLKFNIIYFCQKASSLQKSKTKEFMIISTMRANKS